MAQRRHLSTASHFFSKKDFSLIENFSLTKNGRELLPDSCNRRELLPDSYNCRKLLPDSYKCREVVRDSYNCREAVRDRSLLRKNLFLKKVGSCTYMSPLDHSTHQIIQHNKFCLKNIWSLLNGFPNVPTCPRCPRCLTCPSCPRALHALRAYVLKYILQTGNLKISVSMKSNEGSFTYVFKAPEF